MFTQQLERRWYLCRPLRSGMGGSGRPLLLGTEAIPIKYRRYF